MKNFKWCRGEDERQNEGERVGKKKVFGMRSRNEIMWRWQITTHYSSK